MNGIFNRRCDKLAFYGVKTANGETFTKMQGFTALSINKNPKTYKRRYVDEPYEQNDVVGYTPEVSYTFDRFTGNAVHDDIVKITDGEMTGDDAFRSIILVDMTAPSGSSYPAIKREFAVISDSEGGDSEVYSYSGTFKVKGEIIVGTAVITDNTCTFTKK